MKKLFTENDPRTFGKVIGLMKETRSLPGFDRTTRMVVDDHGEKRDKLMWDDEGYIPYMVDRLPEDHEIVTNDDYDELYVGDGFVEDFESGLDDRTDPDSEFYVVDGDTEGIERRVVGIEYGPDRFILYVE